MNIHMYIISNMDGFWILYMYIIMNHSIQALVRVPNKRGISSKSKHIWNTPQSAPFFFINEDFSHPQSWSVWMAARGKRDVKIPSGKLT